MPVPTAPAATGEPAPSATTAADDANEEPAATSTAAPQRGRGRAKPPAKRAPGRWFVGDAARADVRADGGPLSPRRVAACVCAAASLSAAASLAPTTPLPPRATSTPAPRLYKAGRFSEAEAEFQQAWDARPHLRRRRRRPRRRCEVEIGQYREAAEHLAYALKELPISVKEAVRQRLQTRFALARAEVATVRIHVTPPQATVNVNGREFAPVPEEVFVEPGPATVEARMPGYDTARTATQPIRKGASEEVTLTLTPLATQVVEAGSPKSAPLIVVGAGLTVAGLVTGLAFTLIGASKASSADASLKAIEAAHGGDPSPCSALPADPRCSSLQQLNSDSDTMNRVGVAAFIVGGVAGAATLTYLLWPSKRAPEQAGKLRFTPSLSPSYGGASLRVSF